MLMFLLGIFALGAVVFLTLAFVGIATSSLGAFLGLVIALGIIWWLSGKSWGIGKMLAETMPPEPEKPLPRGRKQTAHPPTSRTSLDQPAHNPWTDEDDMT